MPHRQDSRRRWLGVLGTVLLGALGAGCSEPGSVDGGGPVAVPARGAYLGMHFPAGVVDRARDLRTLEDLIGRRFAIDHVYHTFDEAFPSAYDKRSSAAGHTLFLSWSCRQQRSRPVDWRDIASGRWDHLIEARAEAVAELGDPVLMSFCHEPGGAGAGNAGRGAGDYVAAWRHVVDRFARAGTTNVSWVWTLTAHAFRQGAALALYPGDDVVDWVGVDGYVNIGCPWLTVPWSSWRDVFGPANSFAAAHRKPLVVAEFSLREDARDGERKRRWLVDAIGDIREMSQLKAVVGFNSAAACSSYVVSSRSSLAGFRRLANDPWLVPSAAGP